MIVHTLRRHWRNLTYPYFGARDVDREWFEWSHRKDMLAGLLKCVTDMTDAEWQARPLAADRQEYRASLQKLLLWVQENEATVRERLAPIDLFRKALMHIPVPNDDALRDNDTRMLQFAAIAVQDQGGDPERDPHLAAGLYLVSRAAHDEWQRIHNTDSSQGADRLYTGALDARILADLMLLTLNDDDFTHFKTFIESPLS